MLNFRDPGGRKAYQLVLLRPTQLDINLRDVPDFNNREHRSSLNPLTPEDTKSLIEYRLLAAGRDVKQPPLFNDDAVLPIWRETRGYPRKTFFHPLSASLFAFAGSECAAGGW